jgi:dTDP-4-dehydrorhamnose reductase
LAAQQDTLQVVDDQIGAPTGSDLIADVTAHSLQRVITTPSLSGTYHLAAGGRTSWCGYARHVLTWAQAQGCPLRVAPAQIEPVLSSTRQTRAIRPLNSQLNTQKLCQTFELNLPIWTQGVDRMLQEIDDH